MLNTIATQQSERKPLPVGNPGPQIRYDASPLPPVMSLRDFLRLFERHKLLIMLVILGTTIAVAVQQFLAPDQYRSVSQVQVELLDEVGTNQADVNSRNDQRVGNAVRLYRSRSATERVIQDLGLLSDPAFLRELDSVPSDPKRLKQAATTRLLELSSATSESGSDLIQIAVTTKDPELSSRIANQYPDSVQDVRNMRGIDRRHELLASLKEEQARRLVATQKAAKDLSDFRAKARMLVGAGGPEDLAQVNRVAVEAVSAGASSAGSASRSAGISKAASIRSTAQASSPAVEQLERQRATLLAEKAELGTSFGPNHPDMMRVNSQLATVESTLSTERSLARAAANEVAAAEGRRMAALASSDAAMDAARAARLQGALASMTSKAFDNNRNMAELSQLERASVLADEAYSSIADRIEQVEAQMQLEGVNTLLVSPAVPNYDRIFPEPLKMILLALLGSSVIGVLLALARDLIDDRLRTSAQIRRHFGLPTLGMLPTIQSGISEKVGENLVLREPQSLFGEAARSAFSELKALAHGAKSQSVLVTSPLPGDGKSTVSLTLAAAAISCGETAIVLDLDLRKRGLLQTLQNELKTPDIVDVITGKADLDLLMDAMTEESLIEWQRNGTEQASERPRIALLSANRPVRDPASILTSYRMRALVDDLRQRFDKVIINAPATLAVRDARAMCDYTDNTIVVARWGKTSLDQMKATLEQLGGQVDGVIFDHVDYAEHARRRYGDSVQFYMEASDYYSDEVPERLGLVAQVRRLCGRSPRVA